MVHGFLALQVRSAESGAVLEGLFPGAVYELQLAALSHGLLSEDHTIFKPVCQYKQSSIMMRSEMCASGSGRGSP